jgi:hypothetical protein
MKLQHWALLIVCASAGHCAEAWHHPLYIGNGGLWRQRIALDVRNENDRALAGQEATVRVGSRVGEAALTGAQAESLRVCDSGGVEMLWSVLGPDQQEITAGPIPAGSVLTIPVECPPHASVRYWAYFDNPSAWRVPDHLTVGAGVRNGDLEAGAGNAPSSWRHDANDDQHRTSWVTETPHSGQRCLKTVVSEDAEPTWISTRQSNVRIVGGAKYVLSGWVRAQNVKGTAGWYLHVGNRQNSMLISPMLTAGEGSYAWKEVRVEFTAPPDATVADLGTVLRGTGTAWFDDVRLETAAAAGLAAVASPPEKITLVEDGVSPSCGGVKWDYRLPVAVANTLGETRSTLVSVNAAGLVSRLQGKSNTDELTVVFKGQIIPHTRLQDTVLFEAELPPHSLRTYYLCAGRAKSSTSADLRTQYRRLLNSPRNLVKNPDFELGEKLPSDWPGGAEGEKPAGATFGFDQPGLFGKRCVRIEVPATSTKAWTGWRQDVAVQPGRTYLYAAWLKCANLDGQLQLHAHRRNAKGEICKTGGYTGAGPAISGTTDWTLLSGQFDMSEDCVDFQVHLTMLATGTAWHDGVVVAEVTPGEAGPLQGHSVAKLTMWPVNAVVKVFREDVPPPQSQVARIASARNEYEPLQVAVRSPQTVENVKVVVNAPVNAAGRKLPAPEIGVIGYVPIDHPSSYYSSDTPEYYRKFPRGGSGSDGFAGMWPDPILPRDTFDLTANQTQPLWLTMKVPVGAAAGDYTGSVTLVSDGKTLAKLPFTVHVWGFALPEQGHLKAIYDVRQSSDIWQQPGEDQTQVRQEFWKFMADRRVCPDRIRPEPVIRYENGQVISDFTAFDKAAEYYFDVLHFPHTYTPGAFYLFGWGFPPSDRFGEKPYEGAYPYEGVDRSKLRPEYKRAYQACLRVYWEHMKHKGWADKVALYISDEPYNSKPEVLAQMKALCDMIHEVDPKIPIYCSNWTPQEQWEGYLDIWGAGHYGGFPVDTIKKLQARGDTIWWTTDGQMCTDTPYCGVERLLPHYAFKYGVKAYEFWGIDWLTYNPYEFGWHAYISQSGEPGKTTWVRYPNGDGFLAYPGKPVGHDGAVTSVRLEQAREGMEDYEYLCLLKQAAGRGEGGAAVEAALAQAEKLVDIPNAGGRYSTKILPDPDEVLVLKEQMGKAIEGLKR